MMKLKDIAGYMGVVPALLKGVYDKEQGKMDKLKAENEALRGTQDQARIITPGQQPGITTMKKGGSVKSASARADGIATKGKTRGRIV